MSTSTLALTADQQTCVAFDQRQHLLIRGPAGSGKTLVLLLRAHELASGNNRSVQFVTYATSLVASARQLGMQLMPQGIGCEIRSYHSWCAQKLAHLGLSLTIADSREQDQYLTEALMAARQRKYDSASSVRENPVAWWRDEFAWIKGTLLPEGRSIASLDDYLGASRTGRGSALQSSARVIVWDVFTGYQERMQSAGKADWQDLTQTLLEHYRQRTGVADFRQIEVPASEQTEHLLVDEAQDLHQLELLALSRFARSSLTLVADTTQKIYRTTFSWASIGLSFNAGNVRTLRETFRSTRQIVALARPLMPPEEAAALPEPRRDGPLPVLYVASSPQQEDAALLRIVAQAAVAHPTWSIAVLGRERSQLAVWEARLRTTVPAAIEQMRRHAGNSLMPGVKLSTLHSAKGLEFDLVVIPRLSEGTLPAGPRGYHADAGEEDMAEHYAYEQRLLYVAMTRARHEVILLTSGTPSRFLALLDPASYRRVALAMGVAYGR